MKNGKDIRTQKGGFWNFIDTIEGDKVVWIIVFLLTMFSALAIFSATSQLTGDTTDRIDLIRKHTLFMIGGYGLIILLYNVKKIGWFRVAAQFGFIFSFFLLLILDTGANIGILKAQNINEASRTLDFFGFQIHVFEFTKVAMVMYMAWAIHAYKRDQEETARNKKSSTFLIANILAEKLPFMKKPFWKRAFYMYIPILTTCAMVLPGSNSSAFFIGFIMVAILIIGEMPWKDILLGILIAATMLGSAIGLYKASDGTILNDTRIETLITRMTENYDIDQLKDVPEKSKQWYKIRDAIKQPYTAKIAIHEGGTFGKGSGNSTQKYVVSHIYSDYMYSFIIEEYGLLGGIIILILFVSLLARGSTIARLCNNEFAQIAVGGLSLMISCQAFMHIMVNVDIGPMTGQTLPLISDGRFAFIMFCIAFGTILSISRIARNQIRKEEEEAEPIFENKENE